MNDEKLLRRREERWLELVSMLPVGELPAMPSYGMRVYYEKSDLLLISGKEFKDLIKIRK